jgi:hypothetical protein
MLAKPFDQIAWVEYATVFAAPADNDKCHLLLRKLTQRARVLGRGVDHASRYIDGLEHALDPLPVNARACEGRNAGGDLDAPLIDVASLGLHLSDGIRITAAGLRDRMKRSVQPPPFALDFAFKGTKLVEFIHAEHSPASIRLLRVCSLFVPILITPAGDADKQSLSCRRTHGRICCEGIQPEYSQRDAVANCDTDETELAPGAEPA